MTQTPLEAVCIHCSVQGGLQSVVHTISVIVAPSLTVIVVLGGESAID